MNFTSNYYRDTEAFSKAYLELAILMSGGNVKQAANLIGMNRTTFHELRTRHSVSMPEYHEIRANIIVLQKQIALLEELERALEEQEDLKNAELSRVAGCFKAKERFQTERIADCGDIR